MNGVRPDWRIGQQVKPKLRSHSRFYERGVVLSVWPDGTGGLKDPNGILKIEMETGEVILEPSDQWVTA